MSKGFSMLSKELMDSEYYFSERFTRMQAYMDLCLLAEWKDRKIIKRGQVVELKAGQLAKSEEELAERWQWSRNTVRKYLNEQQSIGNIEQHKSRLITITTVKFGLNVAQQIEQQIPQKFEQQIAQQIEQPTIDNNIDNIEDNNKERDANASSSSDNDVVKKDIFCYDSFCAFFNKSLAEHDSRIPKVRKIDSRRKNMIHARIKDYGVDAIYEVTEKAASNKFLNGGGSKGWVANFDWIFGPDNFRKVIEGNYDDEPQAPKVEQSKIEWQ